MDRTWTRNTSRFESLRASECVEGIRATVGATAFGYKLQAIAAHVLVRLGYRIVQVNRAGHPDIVSIRSGTECRFEIEAEVKDPRARKLTAEDFSALTAGPHVAGYFALAVSFPLPYWVIVPADRLIRRNRPAGNALLEALSDKEHSDAWTREYTALLRESCREIRRASFGHLVRMALAGRRL